MDKNRENIIRKTIVFFDKLEDRVRGHLSHYPVAYTIIGGVAIVLFWRGVWHTADVLQAQGGVIGFLFSPIVNTIVVVIILLMTGLFVSYFIGDTILMSGIKGEKKVTERTQKEVKEEEEKLKELRSTIKEMKKEVDEIKHIVEEEDKIHHRH
jgi:uncharacterized membrane protein (DUF106 family)